MAGERLDRVVERARAVVRGEGERRPPARRRAGRAACTGATETKRVYASGWSPTLASMTVSPLILRRPLARDRDDRRVAELRHRSRRRRPSSARRRRSPRASRRAASGTGRAPPGASGSRAPPRAAMLRRADEAVADREDRLGDDRERRLVQQVVRLGDGPDERALDREHAVRHAPADDRVDDVARTSAGRRAGPPGKSRSQAAAQ